MSLPHGRQFWKMSGSGNDFVFFDARTEAPGRLAEAAVIDRLCARATGVGADGVVFLQRDAEEAFRIRYFNRDGSLGELCGNASLCTTRLARELGVVTAETFRFATDAGPIRARFVDGQPEIDLQPVRELKVDAGLALATGEKRMGYANTGVPHLVVLVEDTALVDVTGRGRPLRHDRSLAAGANVNFVAGSAGFVGTAHPAGLAGRGGPGGEATPTSPWKIRTYERGVEGETLACGTGAVATAVLLRAWGLSGAQTALETKSGRILTVSLRDADGAINPSLRGEGRVVFTGELGEY